MDKKGKNKTPRNTQFIIIAIVAGLAMLLAISMFNTWLDNATTKEISYNQFIEKLEAGEIGVVYRQSDRLVIKPKKQISTLFELVYYTGIMEDETALQTRLEAANEAHGVQYGAEIPDSGSILMDFLLVWVLPLVLFYLVLGFFMRRSSKGGGIMGVGKSNAKIYGQKETGVTFKDVAGQDEAKESMTEIVDFLHNPGKYAKIGAKLPKGALLVGPPGTGKTLLAKAVAGEAKVPFFSLSGSDFVEMFVGVGASRVRDLFKNAQASAPCIIFIDEIDAIGKSRDSRYGGGNDEREQTLNQLLAEMDGFDSSKGVVLLAATNRPEVLDKALLRPGRFDRRIIVDLPDLAGRKAILEVHARKVKMAANVDLDAIAKSTPGASGADLENIINEAALRAVRAKKRLVTQTELAEAVDVILAGEAKKSTVLSEKEKKIVAYHEIGHALVAALLKNTEPVHKITIIPRTSGALGYTMQVSEDEKHLLSKEEALEKICVFAGGRAAEQIEFDSVTTGASNDIERATAYAREMITVYGMSDEFGFVNLVQRTNMYLGEQSRLNCSDETASRVDKEIHRVITECYDRAVQLLTDNKDKLDLLAGVLYERENITGEEFMALLEGKTAEEVFAEDANVEAPETDAEDPETVSEEISADGGENATETETSQKDEEVIDDNE